MTADTKTAAMSARTRKNSPQDQAETGDQATGFCREVAHTADVAIRCGGPDLASFFRYAARGMYDLMGIEGSANAPPVEITVSLQAMDVEGLLVDWLGELTFEAETNGLVFERMNFSALSATHVEAQLTGYRFLHITHLIKAVTYHHLKVERDRRGYVTTIVFDV